MNEQVLILSLAAPVLPPGRGVAWEFSGVSRFMRVFSGYAHEPHALRMLFFMRMAARSMRIKVAFYAHGRERMAPGLCAWLCASRSGGPLCSARNAYSTLGASGPFVGLRPSIFRRWSRRVSGSSWWARRSGRARAGGNIRGACTRRGVLPRPAAWFGGLRRRASRTGGVGGGVRSRRAQSVRAAFRVAAGLSFRSRGREVGAAWSSAVSRR